MIASSIACYGSFLMAGHTYDGNYLGVSDKDLATFHRRALLYLAELQPDLICFETIPKIQELKVILDLI